MATYQTNFSIGQVVWAVRHESFYRIVKCFPCGNTGRVKIADEEFICPNCEGRSAHRQYAGEKYYVWGSSKVGQVRIEDEPDRYHQEEPNPKIEYMIHATGAGSGQIWKQEALFASQEEAQAFCDVKNRVLPEHEAELLQSPVDSYGRVR